MEVGDTIDVRGPSGRLIYHGRGDFEIKAVKRIDPSHNLYAKKISMIAGNIKVFKCSCSIVKQFNIIDFNQVVLALHQCCS